MITFLATSTVLILTTLIVLVVKYAAYRREVDQFAGPEVNSLLVGNLGLFLRPPGLTIRQYIVHLYKLLLNLVDVHRSDGAFRLWFGPFHTMFVLTNADTVEKLLSSPVNVNKGDMYRFMAPWLGDGLLLANSTVWRGRRKILTPAFHFKILENFIPLFARHTDLLLQQIHSQSRCGNVKEDNGCRPVALIDDIRPLFEDLTLNIINETSMGIGYDQINGSSGNESYRQAMKHAFRGAAYRAQNPLYWFDALYYCFKQGKTFHKCVTTMRTYVDRIINKRMEDFKEKIRDKQVNGKVESSSPTKETIFLDLLLEKYFFANEHNSLSPDSLRSEVNTFILGGHDTTAMALTFTVLMVGSHSHVQSRIAQELDSVFAGDMQKEIDMNDLKQMRYLEMVIKETLRLYPSIQMIGRRLSEPLTLPDGKIISANSSCYVPILSLHLDPKIYPNPGQFNPDRFLPENILSTNPYAYIPFSAGPRNCIGQKYALLELKYVLAALFRRYRVTSHTQSGDIIKELTPVIKPLTKIQVSFEEIC